MISEGSLVTPSDKPENSEPQPEEEADGTSVITHSAEEGTTSDTSAGGNASANAESGDPAGTQAGDGSSATAEPDPTQAPPPWQRASATGEDPAGETTDESGVDDQVHFGVASAGTPGAAGSADADAQDDLSAEDTQTIPRQFADQETVRTEKPNSGRGVSFGSSSSASRGGPTTSARRPSRGPRRASLQVKRVDPWSVLKLALVLSVALFFVWMIAVAVLYGVLDGMGVWDQLNGTITELTQPEDAASEPLISAARVFGVATIIGGINIVLITALATVAAFIYNVAADFAGGAEVTLSERE